MPKKYVVVDGNTAAAAIAYAFSEVAVIYPITPASPMAEAVDAWSVDEKNNLFGFPVLVTEMQSEAGAAGTIHGVLTAGSLATTFTASQGLLLMLPNMFKIAGEMLPTVFHVAARSLAYQSLSIFGDHSDVMASRTTGFAMLCSANVQEAQDFAAIAHLATLESSIPFLHFFDGFRTSHEIQKIELLEQETLRALLDIEQIDNFRSRALTSEHPVAKVGAENPDVYFQGREASNKAYLALPDSIKKHLQLFAQKTGRRYDLFTYVGAADAAYIIIAMGSATETVEETVHYLNMRGEHVGMLKVSLYRPFSVNDCVAAIPQSVKAIAVLDRTKESGSVGEPLYLDIVSCLQGKNIKIIGGRYGLSSKEFTPSMVAAIFSHLRNDGFHGFTVGITDDITHTSLSLREMITTEPEGTLRAKFWGCGSDGTVSASKNAIKIIGESTELFVQAYFVYDSKKSGNVTVSHLRFGKNPIQSEYLLTAVDYVSLHKTAYIDLYDVLENIVPGGIFVINATWSPETAFNHFTSTIQKTIINKKIIVYTIDASAIAEEGGLRDKIGMIMQAAFFLISAVLPQEKALALIAEQITEQFKSYGDDVIRKNMDCINCVARALHRVIIPKTITVSAEPRKMIPDDATLFEKTVIEPVLRMKGDEIPVSAMTITGAVPTGTARIERRGIAARVPFWIPESCIACGFCSFVCPHAAIRVKQIAQEDLAHAPQTFNTISTKMQNTLNLSFRVQVYPEHCTGCGVCIAECPTKKKSLTFIPVQQSRDNGENENQAFFDTLPDNAAGTMKNSILNTQLQTHLFEFCGACAGCGEAPYIRLVTQLFGERMMIANATGCSSIFSGTFPFISYTKNNNGKGPAWANSLFEDNAEYGFGMRLALDVNRARLRDTIERALRQGTTHDIEHALQTMLTHWQNPDVDANTAAAAVLAALPKALANATKETKPLLKTISELRDFLTDKSVWIIGGDGWAYDIGFGGLDHVLAQGKKVRVLVLDSEVYSNTGGQASKATPRGATTKFAVSGKKTSKKNLGHMFLSYQGIYVASINMAANKTQAIRALIEAEQYPGSSLVIAYAPCINHGFDMAQSTTHAKNSVNSGYWPLYRYNPSLIAEGKNPFIWDSPTPTVPYKQFLADELRYKSLLMDFPQEAEDLYKQSEQDMNERNAMYAHFAEMKKQ